MGRPVTNDDKAHRKVIRNNKKWKDNIPVHYADIGLLYPFYKKSEQTKYLYQAKLRNELNKTKPQKNALGANVSLLQGKIGGPTINAPIVKKPSRRKELSPQEATNNILEGKGRRKKKNPKALHKLVFNDEKNEMFS
jgi:hypothetical protein